MTQLLNLKKLKEKLLICNPSQVSSDNYYFNNDGNKIIIDYNFNKFHEKQTARDMLNKLKDYSEDMFLEIDIEDGFTYSEVIDVVLNYKNELMFVDKCYGYPKVFKKIVEKEE